MSDGIEDGACARDLAFRAVRGEFPGISGVDALRILNDRQFERDMREAHHRDLRVGGERLRGPHNKMFWFDESFNGLTGPKAVQAAARIERGPLPEGTRIFDIETRSADEVMKAALDLKSTFFEEFVGPVEVGCWPPPVSGTIVVTDTDTDTDTDKEEDDNA